MAHDGRQGTYGEGHHLIGILLLTAQKHLARRVVEYLRTSGFPDLREAHQPVFALLPADGARLTDLAESVGITKQSMGSMVDYLETCGYIRRRPDAADGRCQVIERTPRGWAVHAASMAAIAEVQDEWAELIGAKDMQTLTASLERIGASLGLIYTGSPSDVTQQKVRQAQPYRATVGGST